MSDDPSRPDFTETADFPLDESARAQVRVPELTPDPPPVKPGPILGSPADAPTLFAEARPLGIETHTGFHDEPILEDGIRAGIVPLTGSEPQRVPGLFSLERLKGLSLYRRQSTIAALVLCALTAGVIITFPSLEKEVEGELSAESSAPTPAGASVDGNDQRDIDAAGSEGFFNRSKGDTEVSIDDDPDRLTTTAESEAGAESDAEAEGEAEDADSTENDPAEDPSTSEDDTGPPTTEIDDTEDSVFVGPGLIPTTEAPPTVVETTSPPSASVVEPTTVTTNTPTTDRPTTVDVPTTEQPATTERPTTTAQPGTTERPTTTKKPDTTEQPVTTEEETTTSESETSATTDPDDPQEGGGGTVQPPVACTDPPTGTTQPDDDPETTATTQPCSDSGGGVGGGPN